MQRMSCVLVSLTQVTGCLSQYFSFCKMIRGHENLKARVHISLQQPAGVICILRVERLHFSKILYVGLLVSGKEWG
jgi:hypothetical protein